MCAQLCSDSLKRMAPLSMAFSRQGYWSGLPFPTPGDLPTPGVTGKTRIRNQLILIPYFSP